MAEEPRPEYLQQQADCARLVACLVEGGYTQNGPLLDFWDAVNRTGIEKERLYHAIHYLRDGRNSKRFLESYPDSEIGSINALARIRGRENETRPWKVSIRLTEEGMKLAREELAVQHQYKQLKDFDKAASRAKWSFGLSIAALACSLGMLIFKACETIKKDEPSVLEHVQPATPAINPDPAHVR